MPRVLFPNIPMRLVLQPRNKLVQNRLGLGSAAERRDDPRTADPWSKVALHVPPSTSKFEIKQYLSKVYNADVQKARPRLPSPPARSPAAPSLTAIGCWCTGQHAEHEWQELDADGRPQQPQALPDEALPGLQESLRQARPRPRRRTHPLQGHPPSLPPSPRTPEQPLHLSSDSAKTQRR